MLSLQCGITAAVFVRSKAPRHCRRSLKMWFQRVGLDFSRAISKSYFYCCTSTYEYESRGCVFSGSCRKKQACMWYHMTRNVVFVVFWGTLLRRTAGAVVLIRKATTLQNVPWLCVMVRPFCSFDVGKTPAVNGERFFSLPVSSSGVRPPAPSGPRPAGHGRGQSRGPSQTPSWQRGSSNNPIVMPVIDHTDPWTDKTSRCWPLEEHHYAEVFAVSASFKTDDPPLWSALLSPPRVAPPSAKIEDIA